MLIVVMGVVMMPEIKMIIVMMEMKMTMMMMVVVVAVTWQGQW